MGIANRLVARRHFDVIIVGGSYSGLAAGLALGRALRSVLIIDSGRPCNIQTPHSHNFITQDGTKPNEISALARQQVAAYNTVEFFSGVAKTGHRTDRDFTIQTDSGEAFASRKLIFATGIRDVMPAIPGFAECWGISALHCPYCHGYEVRNQETVVLGNGDFGFDFASLLSNWTKRLTLLTNGPSDLTAGQSRSLEEHGIPIIESPLAALDHDQGRLHEIIFKDGTSILATALYARLAFEQHCEIPGSLGCQSTAQGYLRVEASQKTTVPGIFACGDNSSSMRTVANAVAAGTTTGMMVNKELTLEDFRYTIGS